VVRLGAWSARSAAALVTVVSDAGLPDAPPGSCARLVSRPEKLTRCAPLRSPTVCPEDRARYSLRNMQLRIAGLSRLHP
jgi:hypothetical protein